jgi:hypothetical protein
VLYGDEWYGQVRINMHRDTNWKTGEKLPLRVTLGTTGYGNITPNEAREYAMLIMAAADEAERAQKKG